MLEQSQPNYRQPGNFPVSQARLDSDQFDVVDDLPQRRGDLCHAQSPYRARPVKLVNTLGPYEELFANMLKAWELTSFAAPLLGSTNKSRAEYILKGLESVNTLDEKARIAELFAIFDLTHSLIGDFKAEIVFMSRRQETLDAAPFELLREGSFSNLQKVRNFVETLTGF